MNLATHALALYGTFICEGCVKQHLVYTSREVIWPKKILEEHWDDYQLLHVARGCGGNQPLYQFFQEYELDAKTIKEKYSSRAFAWYRKRHYALCEGTTLSEERPSKNWNERLDKTKSKSKEIASEISTKTSALADKVAKSKTFSGIWRKLRGKKDE